MRTIDLGVEVWVNGLVAASDDELFVNADGAMTHVRLARLPAETTRVGARPQSAARTDSGAWLLSFYDERRDEDPGAGRGSRIAWLAPGATAPSDESRAPFTVETLHSFGDAIVAVPHLGDAPVRPWIHEGGEWREIADVPPRAPSGEKSERATARTLKLGDGTWVLLWNGGAFERRDGRFVRAFETRFDIPWFKSWEPVAWGNDAFFHLVDGLVEVGRDRPPVKHFAGVTVTDITPGPDGTLLVLAYPELVVYDPRGETVALVPADVFAPRGITFFRWTPPGLVIGRFDVGTTLVPAEEFAALAREPVADYLARRTAPPKPPPAMDGAFPFSRARVAAHEDRIAIIAGSDLRAHTVDEPKWKRAFPRPLVSVAASAGAYGVLDDEGVLRVVADEDGRPRWGRAIAPNPRALLGGDDGSFVVLASGGVFFVDAKDTRRVPFELPIAAAFDDRARLLVSGEHGRMAIIDGDSVTPLPPLADARAVAFANGAWLALAGLGLHRFDDGAWSRVDDASRTGRFLVGRRDGKAYATGTTLREAKCVGEGEVRVFYGETYSAPDAPLAITGLAFLGDGRLVVALDAGRANIVSPEGALELDEHPGDAPSRWTFFHPKGILVAG